MSFFCDKRVLPRYRGSTRAFLSILLPGSKTVRAAGAIDVLGSFWVQVASVKTESKVLVASLLLRLQSTKQVDDSQ